MYFSYFNAYRKAELEILFYGDYLYIYLENWQHDEIKNC